MPERIVFSFPGQGVSVTAELFDTDLAQRILSILPFEGRVNTWGKEIYFPIPVKSGITHPREVVEKGDIAYWPDGACLCLFFGPTPASRSAAEIRPASPVEVVGKIEGDLALLEAIPSGSVIRIVRKEGSEVS
ncbi:MAG: cyclophilin-like fold protein [Candidatus Caldatribacterium sp.]|uniref:cyclophilin-like fold protein n=1 Tax=Candidatus Caldatribacterium sp. TaxID=2282143 RepID=UPI002994E360|nr:cyclophilin-like fold protein [Candidatus Caldatribacterium sp.]MCX7730117.1 cyclophilin-like fold protein [Candidatus Caldatribacterium sp.]MDW8081308.1 cyclophilin-like fold protein [Candidatus Calescibacterium sp.]